MRGWVWVQCTQTGQLTSDYIAYQQMPGNSV